MKDLHLTETQISNIRTSLENGSKVRIGDSFGAPDFVAAGFEATSPDQANNQ
jgi:hypothetical protein